MISRYEDTYLSGARDQMTQFLHVVLTRFNVRTEFSPEAAPGPDWLAHRIQLFEQFAYPSMRNQINQDFVWFVFLDKLTPRPFLDRIQRFASEYDKMHLVFVETIQVGTPELLAILRPLISPFLTGEMTHLISTRFDNDDALSNNFIALVQEQFTNQAFEFINLPNGYLWQNNKLYTKNDPSNPFISLIETAVEFKTVWCSSHHVVEASGNIRQVEATPHWIQVVHRRNVSNRVRVGNIRLPVKTLPATFHLAEQFKTKQEFEELINLENLIKKKIRRFRWKWKQFRKRIFPQTVKE